MPSNRHASRGGVVNVRRRIGLLAAMLALMSAQVAFGADPPKGSHGQETDTPTGANSATYSLAVRQICAHAMLFEHPHSIGTRTGARAVADDIRASSRSHLERVVALPAVPAQRASVVRWLAIERHLAEIYARNYVHIYDLIATPRTPRQDTQAARRIATLLHAPDRLRQAAERLEQQLRLPDCIGG
jgi:hypothetical protein